MARGGRTEPGSRRRARTAGAVVSLPQPSAGDRLDLARLVPSGRSLLFAFVIFAGSLAAYWGARESSVFAVERLDVRGAPPHVVRDVQRTTRHVLGTSLLEVDAASLEAKIRNLPSVAAASVDRAFPQTLVVWVSPVRAVGVVRQGRDAWLVSGENAVMRRVEPRAHPRLPRVWVPRRVAVHRGRPLPAAYEPATRTLAALREVRVRSAKAVRISDGEVTVVLHDRRLVLIGEPVDIALKLAVAARVLPLLDDRAAYLDVSVPERPVAGTTLNSQVEPESMGEQLP